MAELEVPQAVRASLTLASVIKLYGKDNVLEIKENKVKLPFEIKTILSYYNRLHLVLVEGEESIKKWNEISEAGGVHTQAIPIEAEEPT